MTNRRSFALLYMLFPLLAAAQSKLEIVEPQDAAAIRPGQTIVVAVQAGSAYTTVWLMGDDAIKAMQMLQTPPYRFSVAIPAKVVAGLYHLWATACRRPGDCDSLDPIGINVEPVWRPSEDGSNLVHDAPGVTIDTAGVPLMHRSAVAYPPEALEHWIGGTVVVEVTPDGQGKVEGVQALSGPQELQKGVIQAVLRWHFPREAGQKPRRIQISFDAAEAHTGVGGLAEDEEPLGVPNTSLTFWRALQSKPQLTLESIHCVALSEDESTALLKAIPFHPGETIDANQFRGLTNVVHNFDDDLLVWILLVGGRLSVTITPQKFRLDDPEQRIHDLEKRVAEAQRAMREQQQFTPQRIKVSAAAEQGKLVSKVDPDYPAIAKASHIQGTVRLSAIIGKDGRVLSVELLNGHALLAQAAEAAAMQRIYAPTFVNGAPVEVVTEIEIEFYQLNP
ncbi:MAG TPA: TonB family protein [Bryobacteraceae bacterium]|nr:TonB family protein [Bryobacteraceae bacterium]